MRIILFISIFMILFSCGSEDQREISKPNIVLIMADDLGYGDLSCYGNREIYTPNIDALASNGVRFMDFHSNGSVCSPTRAALMTGKYQQRTGVSGVITAKSHREVGMPLEEITLAEELATNGYACAMFGKWHLGYAERFNPRYQGFDEFTGFVSGNVDYHAHIDQEGYLDWWQGNKIANEDGYSTDLISQKGVEFIDKNNPSKTGKPFFLYLPHEAPHGPYQRRIDKAVRRVGKAGTLEIEKDSIKSIYKEMVEVMDEGIGLVIDKLEEVGQLENTIIIFISDNGANRFGSNGLLRGFKSSAYEGGSRVPAIFHYPDKLTPGSVNSSIVMTMDLLPTLLDFIDAKPQETEVDGISIKDNLLQNQVLEERDIFFEFKDRSYVRRGDWKLVMSKSESGSKTELFDLAKDIGESQDLSAENPTLVSDLLNSLEEWKQEVNEGVEVVSN